MSVLGKLEKALSELDDKLNELQEKKLAIEKSKSMYNNECFILHALYEDEEDLTDKHVEWCFDNNIVMRLVILEIPGVPAAVVEGYLFKTAEDAAGFKLKWL